MKKIILFSNLLLIFASIGLCQETDIISKVPPLKKGKIILTDGTAFDFKQLSVINDTVVFTNTQAMLVKYPANDIYKISKTGNWAALSAASAGLGWMLGAFSGTSDWDNYQNLKDKKNSFIYGGAIVSAAIGGAIGALIKKDKTIYKNKNAFSVSPIGYISLDNKVSFMLTCRININ